MSNMPSSNENFTTKGVLTDEEITWLEKMSIIEPVSFESKHTGVCTVTPDRLQTKPWLLQHAPDPTEDNYIDAGKPYQVNIPLAKESISVLEFLGFKLVAARELWSGFTRQTSSPKPVDFMDYVYEHISLLQTPTFRTMDVEKALLLMGLERDFKYTLFDLRFSVQAKSKGLYAKVKHIFGDRYARICWYHKALKERAGWYHRALMSDVLKHYAC
jgi:hypothetical protein